MPRIVLEELDQYGVQKTMDVCFDCWDGEDQTDHPPFEETGYRCEVCGEPLGSADD